MQLPGSPRLAALRHPRVGRLRRLQQIFGEAMGRMSDILAFVLGFIACVVLVKLGVIL